MTECIFHSDKLVFDKMRKDLQKAKVLPRTYGPRLAMAVCSCRKHETSLDSEINEDLSEEILVLSTEINQPMWDTFPTTQSYLQDIVKCQNLSISQKKLVLVIDKALDKNFDALKEEFRKDRLEELNRVKKPRFNHIGLANIIRKKKSRYPVTREATLPIFGGNSKLLENQAGKGFVKVGKTYDCFVRFDSEKTRKYMDDKTPKTVITIWCQSMTSFEEILQHLQSIAEPIQSECTRIHQIRRERMKEMRRNRPTYHDDKPEVRPENIKEKLADDYSKKMNKDRKHKKFGRVNKEELSPLKGGHCMNCFKEFDSLKAVTNDECKYHKGYIKYRADSKYWEWSCCYEGTTDRQHNTYEMHQEYGCETGRHVWRPHAKASRGDKSEKMLMQRMLKRK